MSDEQKNDPPQTQPLIPVAIFEASTTRVLLGLSAVGGRPASVFQLGVSRAHDLPAGTPDGTMTLEQAIVLRALLDKAIGEGITMTTKVFDPPTT